MVALVALSVTRPRRGGGRLVGGLMIAGLAPAGQRMNDWLRMIDCDGVVGLAGAGGPGNRGSAYCRRLSAPWRRGQQSRADGRMIAARSECGAFARLRFAAGALRAAMAAIQGRRARPRWAGAENGAIDGGQYSIERMGSSNG